jgi:hypothetical protein
MSRTIHHRRRFRRVAFFFLLLLLPVAAWSLWDYVEAWRLSTTVREIQSRGEPIAANGQPRVPEQFHSSAAAYYDAAAMLMDRSALSEIETALYYERGDRAALMARLRSWLDVNAEADRMLDQATTAEFRGFQAYQDHLRWDRLMKVSSLARARVVERLDAHDGDSAAAALVRQLRIARAMAATTSDFLPSFFHRALADLDQVLGERPSESTLQQLQQTIRVNDRDAIIHEDALNGRGLLIESLWNPGSDWYGRPSVRFSDNPLEPLMYFVARPWQAHRVTRELPPALESLVPAFIDRVPVDPFSGSPVKLRSSTGSYAIYSVGANFKDDGGVMLKAPRTPGTGARERPELAPDYGVAVTLEPRKTSG